MELPKRKRQRLKDYDYSTEGYYFVTICTKNKEKIFCTIENSCSNDIPNVRYTDYGKIAKKHLLKIEEHFDNVTIDKFVIMPNHIHIILIIGCNLTTERSRPFPTLSAITGLYKSGVSKEIGLSIWQKSFHDHIIRNEKSYQEIWNYIDNNPATWEKDCFF